MKTAPKCIKCGRLEDLMDLAMAPGLTYCAGCRKTMVERGQPPVVQLAQANGGRVDQTIFYDQGAEVDGVYGNCLQAAVASLLGIPLDAVPHFLAFGDGWWEAFISWLDQRGCGVRVEPYVDEPSGPCLVLGRSSRHVSHVIARFTPGDEWDPHPSREGLVSRSEVWHIEEAA